MAHRRQQVALAFQGAGDLGGHGVEGDGGVAHVGRAFLVDMGRARRRPPRRRRPLVSSDSGRTTRRATRAAPMLASRMATTAATKISSGQGVGRAHEARRSAWCACRPARWSGSRRLGVGGMRRQRIGREAVQRRDCAAAPRSAFWCGMLVRQHVVQMAGPGVFFLRHGQRRLAGTGRLANFQSRASSWSSSPRCAIGVGNGAQGGGDGGGAVQHALIGGGWRSAARCRIRTRRRRRCWTAPPRTPVTTISCTASVLGQNLKRMSAPVLPLAVTPFPGPWRRYSRRPRPS